MFTKFIAFGALPLAGIAFASTSVALPPPLPTIEQQADAALAGDRFAWEFVEGITTEVGPRQAGTEAESVPASGR